MKRTEIITIISTLVFTMFVGCTNKELCYDHRHGVRISLVIRWSVGVDVDTNGPTYVLASFYPAPGANRIDHYIDPAEPYLYLAEQSYDVVVYNWRISADAQTVQFRGGDSFDTLEAFTGVYSRGSLFSKADGAVVLPPDSLWVWSTGSDRFVVSTEEFYPQNAPNTRSDDAAEEIVIELETEPVMMTHYHTLTVDVMGNTDAVAGVDAVVSGCMGSLMLSSGECRNECSVLCDASYDNTAKSVTCRFSTFGFAASGRQTVTFRTQLPDGSIQVDLRDVTDLLTSDEGHIVEPINIVYDKPDGGGGVFRPPVVGDWRHEFEEIEM